MLDFKLIGGPSCFCAFHGSVFLISHCTSTQALLTETCNFVAFVHRPSRIQTELLISGFTGSFLGSFSFHLPPNRPALPLASSFAATPRYHEPLPASLGSGRFLYLLSLICSASTLLTRQVKPRNDVYGAYDHSYLQTSGPQTHTQSPIVTGTSVVAVKFKDGVAIAADNLGAGSCLSYHLRSGLYPRV